MDKKKTRKILNDHFWDTELVYYKFSPRVYAIVVEPPQFEYYQRGGGFWTMQIALDKKHHKKPPLVAGITGAVLHPDDESEFREAFISLKPGDKVSFTSDIHQVRLYPELVKDGEGMESGMRIRFIYTRDYKFEKEK